jgi:co-chaperonin GroES (HSP10)
MIEPLLHRILVKPLKFEEFSEDMQKAKAIGLVIPELEEHARAQASVDQGVVVAYGPTAFRDFDSPVPIAPGMVVNYARFSGKYVTDPADTQQYVILNDEDLICIIKE